MLAIEHAGIPGIVLMENAGRGVWRSSFTARWSIRKAAGVTILCGPGNNGGDGFVVARHLHNAGVKVDVVLATAAERSQGDAGANLRILERMGLEFIHAHEAEGLGTARLAMRSADAIVDALLGTGSNGAPRGPAATLIECANAVPHARRIAVDIPSGLDADRGDVHEPCFRATATVTMVAPKVGFDAAGARSVVGRITVVDIGLPRELVPGHKTPPRGA